VSGADPRRTLGGRGEEEAARHLAARGFAILDRNVRSRLGEIDLVARDGGTLVFVEVKARRAGQGDPPQSAVTPDKQRRLARLARLYLKQHGLGEVSCRFDVVAVTLDARDRLAGLRHLPGAFHVQDW
jgi:putative endonuclease